MVQVPLTVTVAVALSSASGLTPVAVTVAVSVSVPGVVTVTTIVIVALLPALRLPTLQLTVPPLGPLGLVQAYWVVDTELKWMLAGSGSPSITLVAVTPPVLVAV